MTGATASGGVLHGRVVLVTGSSSGLGERFVRTLAAEGAHVAATARRAERLEGLVDELGADRLLAVPGDITDAAFVDQLFERVADRFGRLDVLVNNAGTTRATPAEDEELEVFGQIIAVNLTAVFACCRRAFPLLRDSEAGSIVNIGSALGLVGIGRIPQAAYCASKGAVVNLTRELAAQWAKHGIRVNCLAPGWFPSEMTSDVVGSESGTRYIDRTVPMRRPGRQPELDAPLLLLAGPGGSYMTGQTLVVDGGWTSV